MSATHTFSEWAKDGDEFEQRFADFRVAFDHPYHGQPVFNLSDPLHLWKKLVNALWYSDFSWKARNLAKVCVDPDTGGYELVEFSLKTLEKVWYNEGRGRGQMVTGGGDCAAHAVLQGHPRAVRRERLQLHERPACGQGADHLEM